MKMKYRVVTDGYLYRIQKYSLLWPFWIFVRNDRGLIKNYASSSLAKRDMYELQTGVLVDQHKWRPYEN